MCIIAGIRLYIFMMNTEHFDGFTISFKMMKTQRRLKNSYFVYLTFEHKWILSTN